MTSPPDLYIERYEQSIYELAARLDELSIRKQTSHFETGVGIINTTLDDFHPNIKKDDFSKKITNHATSSEMKEEFVKMFEELLANDRKMNKLKKMVIAGEGYHNDSIEAVETGIGDSFHLQALCELHLRQRHGTTVSRLSRVKGGKLMAFLNTILSRRPYLGLTRNLKTCL